MAVELKVKKRGGGTEEWNHDKLLASINKAGVPIAEAEKMAKSIKTWAEENADGGVVDSVKLRDRVIENMKDDYPAESDSYQAYKKE